VSDPSAKPSTRRLEVASAVAAAVDSVPGAERSPGHTSVEVATHHAGGRVIGIGLQDEVVLICVSLSRLPVPVVADEIAVAAQAALRRVGDKRRVQVDVDDIDVDRFPTS
jgi:hypothetical protein